MKARQIARGLAPVVERPADELERIIHELVAAGAIAAAELGAEDLAMLLLVALQFRAPEESRQIALALSTAEQPRIWGVMPVDESRPGVAGNVDYPYPTEKLGTLLQTYANGAHAWQSFAIGHGVMITPTSVEVGNGTLALWFALPESAEVISLVWTFQAPDDDAALLRRSVCLTARGLEAAATLLRPSVTAESLVLANTGAEH